MTIDLTSLIVLATIINVATVYLLIRAMRVLDFRSSWLFTIKEDPIAQGWFRSRVASFSAMLRSFRPLRDSKWIPANLRAARYRAELEPSYRDAMDELVELSGLRPPGFKPPVPNPKSPTPNPKSPK